MSSHLLLPRLTQPHSSKQVVNQDHKQKTFTSGQGNLQDLKLILQLGTVSGHYALLTQQ